MKSALIALFFAFIGCTPGGGPTPQTVQGVAAGVDFAVCVLSEYASCEQAHTPWPMCSVQIIQACGGDAVTVARVVDAHRGSEIREGYLLPDAGGQ